MIYLDHAATSFPKPDGVRRAVADWFATSGVSARRGASQICRDVARIVEDTRARLARRCGVPTHRLVFMSGATAALNTFLNGTLRPGDRVLTTALEHSSLARPLVHLREERGIEFDVLHPGADGRIPAERFAEALERASYRLIAFCHASNVLGSVVDAASICAAARRHGVVTLLDASPTAGLLDLDVGADAVAASAHKSLLGPPGLGFLAVAPSVELAPTRWGGTGSSTALDRQPETWPEILESGTPNTPAILGLAAALDYLDTREPETLLDAELALIDELRSLLDGRARLFGPIDGPRLPILSFTYDGFDPAEVGLLLDTAGVHVRTGFHCAPWVHDHIGSAASGTVRVSVGPFNSSADIQALAAALPHG